MLPEPRAASGVVAPGLANGVQAERMGCAAGHCNLPFPIHARKDV